MTVWGIVVAGGQGHRFGGAKQFEPLGDARVIDLAVTATRARCDHTIVVLPARKHWDGPPVDAVATGGPRRSDSVRAGLARVPEDAEIVVVHDAARPLATAWSFDAVADAVRGGADGAVPALPLSDTLKRVEGARVAETLVRDDLVVVQTPQAFRAAALRAAHAHGDDTTDDAALVEGDGGRVVVVAGDPRNLKLTTPSDLVIAAALLRAAGAPTS